MSIVHYAGENPVPLRGAEASSAIIELLAVTRWGKLDYLVIDMPPGIGDATLDMIRLIPRIEFLVVTTPSRLAYESVRKLLALLREQRVPTIGVIENMATSDRDFIKEETAKVGVRYLGAAAVDPAVESSIGDPDALKRTRFYAEIRELRDRL
jgi:ATP-binding protein involved in chromosome partitioning